MKLQRYALNFSAPSRRGQVGELTQILESHGAYIEQFFGIRRWNLPVLLFTQCLSYEEENFDLQRLQNEYHAYLQKQGGEGHIWDMDEPVKVLIMVSKTDHCLNTLISASKLGVLNMDIVGIGSNHLDLKPIADHHSIPYYHLPVNNETRARQEQQIIDLKSQLDAEFIVLARYMQSINAWNQQNAGKTGH